MTDRMPRPVRARALRMLTGLAAVLLVLTGCASIPSSGGVNAANPAIETGTPDFDLIARPPVAGMSQDEVLRGFIDAATSARNGYEVARDYLTPEFASEWRAEAGATVDLLQERRTVVLGDDSMRVTATPLAQLGPDGQYDELSSQTEIPLDYRFEQVDGEWRIAEAPTGILIDDLSFDLVFTEHALYFYDPSFEYLVPDLRWFSGRDSVQTSIVRALIDGPIEWLAPGVETAFPEGVRLDPDAVPVEDNVANVDLTGVAFDSQRTAQLMQTQLDESLASVRSVQDVRLSLNGDIIDLPALSPEPRTDPRVDQRAAVADDTMFGYLSASGESITPVPGLSDQIALLQASGVALGRGATAAAVRSAEGVSLVQDGQEPILLDDRPGLIDPAIDGHGYVWSVPADAPDALTWFAPDGSASTVSAPWAGTEIAAIEMSRDSTRLLALLREGERTRFVVASVQRTSDGTPQGLGPVALELVDIAGEPRDAAWLDSGNVAALSAVDGGASRVVRQQLGGLATQLAGPTGGLAIEGGNSLRELRVLTTAGDLTTQSGAGWQAQARGIRLLAAQQPE